MLCLGDFIRRVDFFYVYAGKKVLIENSHAFLTYSINYFSLTVIEHYDQKHIKQVIFFFLTYGSRGIESIIVEKSMTTVI